MRAGQKVRLSRFARREKVIVMCEPAITKKTSM
jgi:hypothetical protein